MATLQVRSIDEKLYKALGRRATMDNRSISQEVVSILQAYLSAPKVRHENSTQAFLELCGTWSDDRTEQEIADEIRRDRKSSDRFAEMF